MPPLARRRPPFVLKPATVSRFDTATWLGHLRAWGDVRARRLSRRSLAVAVTWLALWFVSAAAVAPTAKAEEEVGANKPKTTEAADTSLPGVFESPRAEELQVGGEQIKSWVVKRVLSHGSQVEKRQNVVWLETDTIDKRIRDAEIEFKLAEVGLEEAEFKHEQFLKQQQLDREAAQRARRRARDDYDHFISVDRDQQLKTAQFNLKSAQDALENANEELEQLEKMYRADDLTEESEEIVLRRARRAVENAEFRLDSAQIRTARTVDEMIPRTETDQEEKLQRAELAYRTALRDLRFHRQRRRLELDQQRKKVSDQQEKLGQLRQERKRAVLSAPRAGVVLHGALTRGAMSDKPTTLKVGASVSAEQVLATVVPTKPLQVRLSVPEAKLPLVSVGQKVRVLADAYPDQPLPGTVQSLSGVPYAKGRFDCVVTVKLGKLADQIVPAMGCQVEFPQAAGDDDDDDDAGASDG